MDIGTVTDGAIASQYSDAVGSGALRSHARAVPQPPNPHETIGLHWAVCLMAIGSTTTPAVTPLLRPRSRGSGFQNSDGAQLLVYPVLDTTVDARRPRP